jgi:hypothetical protein
MGTGGLPSPSPPNWTSPLEPFFDKSWRAGEIELVK